MSGMTIWFKGLRAKLLTLAILPVVGVSVIGYLGVMGVNNLGGMLDETFTNTVPTVDTLGDLKTGFNGFARQSWFSYATMTEPELRAAALKRADHWLEVIDKSANAYEKLNADPQEEAMYKVVRDNMSQFKAVTAEIMATLALGTKEGNEQARDLLLKKYRPVAMPMEKATDDIIDYYNQRVDKAGTEATAARSKTLMLTIATATAVGLVVFLITIFVASRLAGNIGSISSHLTESGVQVSAASSQLSNAGQQLSSSSTEAAASLEETVSSLEELSSMVKLNADNAKEAAALSHTSRTAAEQGETEIKALIESMNEISKSSKKIEEIINVIDDIAFQTNLLALNAAVEAARAGEQGKGFAVVAEAVRSLAQRSASAAKDITTLIKESVEKIENGTEIADRSGNVLKNIVGAVKKVSDLNSEISSASQEQSTGIAQISQAMNQLDQATQSNAASAEEVASSAGVMSNLAGGLQNAVGNLLVLVNGSTDGSSHTPSPAPVHARGPELAQVVRLPSAVRPVQSAPRKRVSAEAVLPLENGSAAANLGSIDEF